MKYILIVIILICQSCLISGQDYNLRNFVDSIVERYICEHPDMNEPIIVQCYESDEHYSIDICEDFDGRKYYNSMDYELFSGHQVFFVGEKQSSFFTAGFGESRKLNSPEIYSMVNSCLADRFINFDPDIWSIAFHKDGTLCKMFTYKTAPIFTLDDYIIDLAEEYVGGWTITDYDLEYVYMFVDGLLEFFHDNDIVNKLIVQLLGNQENNNNKKSLAAVIVELIVERDGKSQVSDFVIQTGDKTIDGTAMRVVETISRSYTFKPARHRGEFVRAYFRLRFTESMFQ